MAQPTFPHGLCQVGLIVPIWKSYPLKSQFPWSSWRLCLDHGQTGSNPNMPGKSCRLTGNLGTGTGTRVPCFPKSKTSKGRPQVHRTIPACYYSKHEYTRRAPPSGPPGYKCFQFKSQT